MSYKWAYKYITKDIKLIFEVGSRDCLDAIELNKHFNCKVVAFECNPDGISECINNINDRNITTNSVILVQKAVTDCDGTITFRPFIKEKYNNIGASSLFEIDFISTRDKSDPDYGITDIQKCITVNCIRLDTFIDNISIITPDLLCMDVQESELLVLLGLGNKIQYISYIVTEASSVNTYKNGCTFNDIHTYLINNNFEFIATNSGTSLPELVNTFSFFDCIYKNRNL